MLVWRVRWAVWAVLAFAGIVVWPVLVDGCGGRRLLADGWLLTTGRWGDRPDFSQLRELETLDLSKNCVYL
jgi:hypothetical protein